MKSSILRFYALVATAALTASAQGALTTNLLAYYDFEGTTANNSLATGGSVDNGVLSGNAATTGGTAIAGAGALYLDGNGDFMTVGSLLNLNQSWTISAWFQSNILPSGSSRQAVFESYNSSSVNSAYGMSYGLREGSPTTGTNFQTYTDLTGADLFDDTQVPDVATLPTLDATDWHNIVLTYTAGGNLVGYLDGVQDANLAIPNGTFVTANSLRIGTYRNADSRYFSGSIDEVAVWDRALGVSEINNANTGIDADSVYQRGLAGLAVPEPSVGLLGGLGILCLLRRRR